MSTTETCPDCGGPLSLPDRVCPKCLFARAQAGLSDAPTAVAVSDEHVVPVSCPLGKVQYFGDYELLEEIARGGMGVVYKARQASLNRVVALKMILAGQLASESEIKRFRIEAEAAANLQHPNIVAIHEVGEHEGRQYFSLDYVAGQNLAERAREKPLEPKEAARLVKGIAEAIQYAHQRGILHRDLKPQNVLLDERGQPRITDFGLAKRMEQESGMTLTGAVMGSPSYMPPEQASGRQAQAGPASDVYAIGAVLYHLLTGKAPFVGATPMATLAQVLEAEPEAPKQLNPAVPADLETICLKCLEKKMERRYATARGLAEDLQRFLNEEPVLARPASAWRKGWSWGRRHPWALVLALTALLVALLGAVFWIGTENEFLRYTATHPGYVKKSGPMFRKLEGTTKIMMIGGGIWEGILILFGFNSILVKRGVVKSGRAVWLARPDVLNQTIVLTASVPMVVFGILFLQRGMAAHIWEGTSFLPVAGWGFSMVYFGIFLVHEGIRRSRPEALRIRELQRQAAAQEFAAMKAAARQSGDWRIYYLEAAQGAMPTIFGSTATRSQAAVDWQLTPLRLFLAGSSFVLMIGVSRHPAVPYGALTLVGWTGAVGCCLFFHVCCRALKQGLVSKRRFLFDIVAFLLFYIGFISFASFFGPGSSSYDRDQLGAILGPIVMGAVLGLIGICSLLRWSSPRA